MSCAAHPTGAHHLSFFWCSLLRHRMCEFDVCGSKHSNWPPFLAISMPIRTQCVSFTFLLLLIESHFEKWMRCKFCPQQTQTHIYIYIFMTICDLYAASIACAHFLPFSLFFIAFYCV